MALQISCTRRSAQNAAGADVPTGAFRPRCGRLGVVLAGMVGPCYSARPMYLATRNKPRKTDRKRSVRYKAKLSQKNKGRRKGLQK